MNDRIVTVGNFASPAEAQLALNRLADEGIFARLTADTLAGDFWRFGTSVNGVKLLVVEQDAERAVAILADPAPATHEPGTTTAGWTCGACGSEVPGDFAVCWKCEAPRPEPTSGLLDSMASSAEPIDRPTHEGPSSAAAASDGESPEDESADARVVDTDELSPEQRLEAQVDRAWRAAVFGLVFLPLLLSWLLNCYSFWILLQLTEPDLPWTDRATRRATVAWVANLLVVALLAVFLRRAYVGPILAAGKLSWPIGG